MTFYDRFNPSTWFVDNRSLDQRIDEELRAALMERFDVRLELESAQGREATLNNRIRRLEAEQRSMPEKITMSEPEKDERDAQIHASQKHPGNVELQDARPPTTLFKNST